MVKSPAIVNESTFVPQPKRDIRPSPLMEINTAEASRKLNLYEAGIAVPTPSKRSSLRVQPSTRNLTNQIKDTIPSNGKYFY